jgi:hypothetical protein
MIRKLFFSDVFGNGRQKPKIPGFFSEKQFSLSSPAKNASTSVALLLVLISMIFTTLQEHQMEM